MAATFGTACALPIVLRQFLKKAKASISAVKSVLRKILGLFEARKVSRDRQERSGDSSAVHRKFVDPVPPAASNDTGQHGGLGRFIGREPCSVSES
jgi:hypothetical protein